ncbi:MAG TPA: IS1380 family transposase [Mycobacterium sp.]|nr:IS1380 family transposase [Mycobacterium sp.]HUH70078.1 IS1380 family transposase [Mycobacterium sp.]
MQATTDWSKSLRIEVRGEDVVGHAGNVIPRMLADATGLTSGLSAVLSRPEVTHDRGAVLRDVAVSIAGGAHNLAGTAVLRDQQRLFGQVASVVTMWRSLGEIDQQALAGIALARNSVRERVWELIEARHGTIPASRTCYGDLGPVIVIRIDASLVESHSDNQHAAGNFKGGYGFHPLLAWCDNTGELLVVIARAGNAGSNTAADHVAIIDAAIAAIPPKWRRNLLITIDGAGCSHAVVEHLEKLDARPGWSVAYSVGFDLDERARVAIGQMPAEGWEAALDAAGLARDDAQVAELTGLLRQGADGDRLAGWPADMRILVRREKIEEGRQLSLFEQINGHRYQLIATNTRGGQPQRLEAHHWVHARVEGFIRCGKDTGLARWPSHSFAINTAWVTAVALAIDLLCWTRLLLLDGPLARAEPATLRYRLLHAAARLVRHARRLILRIPETWPWAQEFADAVNRVRAIP